MQLQHDELSPYPYRGRSGFIPLNLFHQDTFKRILGGSRNIRKTCGKVNYNNISDSNKKFGEIIRNL